MGAFLRGRRHPLRSFFSSLLFFVSLHLFLLLLLFFLSSSSASPLNPPPRRPSTTTTSPFSRLLSSTPSSRLSPFIPLLRGLRGTTFSLPLPWPSDSFSPSSSSSSSSSSLSRRVSHFKKDDFGSLDEFLSSFHFFAFGLLEVII